MVYFECVKRRLDRSIDHLIEWQNMTSIILRDYQEEALTAVIKELQTETHRQLIVLPTASGKTIVMAAIAKHFNQKILLIAHREELLLQAEKNIREYWPEADIGCCKAERKEFDQQIILGSTQTCCRPNNLRQLKEKEFDILMIDETHHVPADTYQRIIKNLGFAAGTKKLLVGVTATPMRSDKKELGDFFDKIVYSKTAGELIKAGYLSPICGRRILTSFNLNGVRTQMGDFAVGELASVVNTKERNKFVVDKFKEHALSRKALAFCVDVKHCQELAQSFNTQGIIAEAVWGEMDKEQRKKVLKGFSKSNIQVVTSCGILTEGFDEPSIQAIIMARPTKSKGFYIQMVGRGLRKHPEKEDCLVLDFTDKYHNLNTVITLRNAIPEAKYIEDEKPKIELKRVKGKPKIKTLRDVDRKFDILGARTGLIWIDIGDGEYSLADDHNNEIVMQPQGKGYIATLFYKNGDEESVIAEPKTFKYCIETCENFARSRLDIKYADLNGNWVEYFQQQKPTPPQIKILQDHGVCTYWMNKTQALLEIRKILALQGKENRAHGNTLTPAQRFYLEHSGLSANNLTKHQAFMMIAKLKQEERMHKHHV
jgi:superfamily II DNA or RNA helicase